MAPAQAIVVQAKTLGWRNSGGGEPHRGMRLCPTHRLVEFNKNWTKTAKTCSDFSTFPDLKVQSVTGGGLATFDARRLRILLFGSSLDRSRKPRPSQKPRARPKRRRDDSLHRHVSLTSGKGCLSSRVATSAYHFLCFLCLGAA